MSQGLKQLDSSETFYMKLKSLFHKLNRLFFSFTSSHTSFNVWALSAIICFGFFQYDPIADYIRNLNFNGKIQYNRYGRWTLIFLVKITSF